MDCINDWEFVWDKFDGERGRGDIIGVKAAPVGVAIEIKLILEEGGGGVVLWWNLSWIIFIWFMLMWGSIVIG